MVVARCDDVATLADSLSGNALGSTHENSNDENDENESLSLSVERKANGLPRCSTLRSATTLPERRVEDDDDDSCRRRSRRLLYRFRFGVPIRVWETKRDPRTNRPRRDALLWPRDHDSSSFLGVI